MSRGRVFHLHQSDSCVCALYSEAGSRVQPTIYITLDTLKALVLETQATAVLARGKVTTPHPVCPVRHLFVVNPNPISHVRTGAHSEVTP